MEQIKISTKTNKEAIEVLESVELSAKVATSELYSMENVFSAYCPDVDDDTYKLAELVYSELVKRGAY